LNGNIELAVLITCHNRVKITLQCLRSLYGQVNAPLFDVFLVDDGSTDGTGDAVRAEFPQVNIIPGDGNLYWSGGMHTAWSHALEKGYKAYIWLNDDVTLDPDALQRLYAAYRESHRPAILGFAVRDTKEGVLSATGGMRKSWRMHVSEVIPGDKPVLVDTICGQFTLVPDEICQKIGIFAPYLIHYFGDLEYSLRARRNGFEIFLLPGTAGVCPAGGWKKIPPGVKGVRMEMSPKRLPLSVGVPLYRQYAGPLWSMHLFLHYFKIFIKGTYSPS
jgi:GT2 family glycosyltransferase